MNQRLTSETTLGDLIYALTEDVRRDIHDEKQVYGIVADLLAGITTGPGKINYSGITSEMARQAS